MSSDDIPQRGGEEETTTPADSHNLTQEHTPADFAACAILNQLSNARIVQLNNEDEHTSILDTLTANARGNLSILFDPPNIQHASSIQGRSINFESIVEANDSNEQRTPIRTTNDDLITAHTLFQLSGSALPDDEGGSHHDGTNNGNGSTANQAAQQNEVVHRRDGIYVNSQLVASKDDILRLASSIIMREENENEDTTSCSALDNKEDWQRLLIYSQELQQEILRLNYLLLQYNRQQTEDSHVRESVSRVDLVPYPPLLPQLNITLCDKCEYIHQTYDQDQPLNFELANYVQIGINTYGFVLLLSDNNETNISIKSGDIIYNIHQYHPGHNELCDDIDERTYRSLSKYMLEYAPRPLNITVIRTPQEPISYMDKLTWQHPIYDIKSFVERRYEGMVREIYYNKDGVSLEELDSKIDNDWRMENDDDGTLSSVSRIVQNIAISADTTITSSSLEDDDDGNPTFDVGGEDNSGGRSDRVDSPSSPNNNEERGDNDETTNTSSNEVVIGAHGLPQLRKRREIMIDNNRTALPHIEPPFYYEEKRWHLDNLDDMIKKTNIRRHFHDLLLQRPYIGDDGELAPELLSLWNRNTRMTLSGGQYLPFRMRRERGGQHQEQGEESDDTGPNFEVGGGADEDELGQEMSDGDASQQGAANASGNGNVEVVAALEEDTNNAESMATKQYIVGAKIQAKQDNRGPWKRAVVIEVLGNNKILIFYFPMKQNTPREVKDISSIQLGWPQPTQEGERRSRRLARQLPEEEEEARLVPFHEHPHRSVRRQRNTPIQAEHDMDYSNMHLYSDLHTETESEVFNIATILQHGFIANHPNPNGNGGETEQSFLEASERYANQTTWQVNSVIPGRMYGTTFQDKFTLHGFLYKAGGINTSTVNGVCCTFYRQKSKFGSCGARFVYNVEEETLTITNASHSPECRMRRFLESDDYTIHQKRVVLQVYVQRWETLTDTDIKMDIVEVWHHLTYKKTYFSHDQIFAIQAAANEDNADEVMRLVKLGNDTEGGLQLSQEHFYMGSSMGRIVQVKDGKIKMIGFIDKSHYAMNKLVCIDQGNTDEPKLVQFSQSDLLAKNMKEKSGVEIDLLKQMEDHSNFKRRDNRIRNREGVEAHVNAGRKKSNTTLTPIDGSGWMKLTEAQRQGRGHDVTCRVCEEEAEFGEEDTLVGCSTCIFSFHRSHLFPSVEGNGPVPNGWRCVLCIMNDSSKSVQDRRAASRTWRRIENGEIRDTL